MLKIDTSNLKGDLYGGITAGVVALPLALAMGVASGLGPIAGLYGAIFVGFFAALFGGTPSQVSGPTGPMTVVVAGLVASIASHPDLAGNPELIFTAIILAGIMQIVMGLLKLGDYIRLVPYPVISGFMSGIGGIIIILQISPLLGHSSPEGILNALIYTPTAISDINPFALLLGLFTLAIAVFWPNTLKKWVPGPLAALLLGTLISILLGGVPILGAVPSGLPELHLPTISSSSLLIVGEAALVLALLGAIDSLLTSLVADNMTRSRHNSNKELIGQGIGNTVAGLFGGTAGAGATMRTVVNIRTGGKTRLSGVVHALLLLAVVLGLGPLASLIPHAVLAGILVKVGLDIIDWSYLKSAHKGPRWDLVLMIMVLGLTIFVDLITAVAAGVVLAALAFVRQVAQEQMARLRSANAILDATTQEEENLLKRLGHRISIFDFIGPLSFGAAADLGHHARSILEKGVEAMILDFSRVPHLDVSAVRAIETIAHDAKRANRRLYLSGANPEVLKILTGLIDNEILNNAMVHESRQAALKAAALDLMPSEKLPNTSSPAPTTTEFA